MNPLFKMLVSGCCLALLSAGGCAPPPTLTDRQLRQTVDELRQMQQQQAEQLAQIVAQLAALQQNSDAKPSSTPWLPESVVPAEGIEPKSISELAQASAEIVALTESSALYLQAFGALATGKMSDAAQNFRAFIVKYPNHEFSGNARYWLADALIAQQEDVQAEAVLLEITKNPQEQQRAAAAMARLIQIYQNRGATEQARATAQQLSRRYPASPEFQRLTKDPTLF